MERVTGIGGIFFKSEDPGRCGAGIAITSGSPMINFRVADLDRMLAQLRAARVQFDERVEESEVGRFGWFIDPEGRKIELWQPPRS